MKNFLKNYCTGIPLALIINFIAICLFMSVGYKNGSNANAIFFFLVFGPIFAAFGSRWNKKLTAGAIVATIVTAPLCFLII